jgi:hypothetical protein
MLRQEIQVDRPSKLTTHARIKETMHEPFSRRLGSPVYPWCGYIPTTSEWSNGSLQQTRSQGQVSAMANLLTMLDPSDPIEHLPNTTVGHVSQTHRTTERITVASNWDGHPCALARAYIVGTR